MNPPWRKGERNPPSVADHDAPQSLAEITAPDKALEKPIVCVKLAGLQQADEIEQLLHVVLNRRRSEQEHVLFRDAGDEPPVHTQPVLESMRLVDDDKVPTLCLDLGPMGFALRSIDRRDQKRLAVPIVNGPQ